MFYQLFSKRIIDFLKILQVSATDPDCGVNAVVNYTIGEESRKIKEFEVKPETGEICISGKLDHETRSVYIFPVVATDQGMFFFRNSNLN